VEGLKELGGIQLGANNTLTNLLLFVLAVFVTLLVSRVVQWLFTSRLRAMAEGSKTQLDDVLLSTLGKPIYWVVLMAGFYLSVNTLVLPQAVGAFLRNTSTIIITMFVAWAVSNLITALRQTYIDPLTDKSESKLDDQVVPILEKAIKVAVWAFAVLLAFSNMGYDILSLLTGLGIGGLAIAMAAQDTLANVFGSVTIFADRPFQVGDLVTLAGHTGTVLEVGLRTCRLETFDGTVVTVPNKALVGGPIENLSARVARKHNVLLGLVYETSSDELERCMAATRQVLAAHEKIREDFAVRFLNFGDSALEVQVLFWVVPPSDYFDVVPEVNQAIKRLWDAEGWDMAFPSTTIYQGGSDAR